MFKSKVGFQFFADAGTLVNATGNYVNAGTGQTTAFSGNDTLAPTMKTFYDTQLLENARPNLVHAQLAGRQALPRNHGKTVEWRKWNTLKDAEELTEGVIPTGQKMGQTSTTGAIKQIGLYAHMAALAHAHHHQAAGGGQHHLHGLGKALVHPGRQARERGGFDFKGLARQAQGLRRVKRRGRGGADSHGRILSTGAAGGLLPGLSAVLLAAPVRSALPSAPLPQRQARKFVTLG